MQNDMNPGQAVCLGMLGDPVRYAACGLPGYHGRLVPPALVGRAVNVAMVTCEVAPAMELQHELPKGHYQGVHAGSLAGLDGRIEGCYGHMV